MPWKFVCNLWFHEVFTKYFVKLHKIKGRRQTSMTLNI